MRKTIWVTGSLFIALLGFRSVTGGEKDVKVSPESIRAAINKSIPLLEYSSHTFLENANGCYSCHGQALSAVAFKLAVDKGFTVRDSIFKEALDSVHTELKKGKTVFTECSDPISLPIGTGYGLWALSVNGYKADKSMHLLVRDLLERQSREGNWAVSNNRPPLEYSTYTGTALDIRAIQAYAPAAMQNAVAQSREKARHWLEHADPSNSEERVFQLLGLVWTNADRLVISRQAGKLLALQRPDGGWSQLDSLPSDAYATGKSLYALYQSGQLQTDAPAYQKGLSFLLSTQYPDGSWKVQTRTHPALPFIDSGFPHGKNQFISAAGSNWATMALLLAVGPDKALDPPDHAFSLSGQAQGTTWHITYYNRDSSIVVSQIDSILSSLDSSLSLYKPYSLICQFNRAEKQIRMDRHLKTVVLASLDTWRQTGGLFDITVQPLVEAWGFSARKPDEYPDSARVRSILACIGSGQLSVQGALLVKAKPCIHIDLDGIAQGYSVDVLATFLEHHHITNYLVELGGELRVKGRKQPSGESQRIGIEAPNDNEFEASGVMQKVLAFDSGAVTTSGNYRAFHERGGKKFSHTIDPRTGYPIDNELISVTVFSKRAIISDAYDNVLMIMGLEKAMQFVEKQKDLAAFFIYRNKDGAIVSATSKSFNVLLYP